MGGLETQACRTASFRQREIDETYLFLAGQRYRSDPAVHSRNHALTSSGRWL